MRISVVIPSYNAERWIGDTLASVAAQTRPPDEVIVIDDGSSDRTIEVIEASTVPTKVLRQGQQGPAVARNRGIERATGDLIAFLDADDLWMPGHLERAHDALTASDDVAYIGYFHDLDLDGSARPSCSARPFGKLTSGLAPSQFMACHNSGMIFCHQMVVFRRDRLVEVGMFDPDFPRRHDIDLWLRVVAHRTWSYDPDPGAAYRSGTPGALSRDLASREYYSLRCFLKNRPDYPGPEMMQAIRHWSIKAMLAAVTDGTAADRRLVWPMAAPYLSGPSRLVLGFSRVIPQPLRWANRVRRRRLAARRPAG